VRNAHCPLSLWERVRVRALEFYIAMILTMKDTKKYEIIEE